MLRCDVMSGSEEQVSAKLNCILCVVCKMGVVYSKSRRGLQKSSSISHAFHFRTPLSQKYNAGYDPEYGAMGGGGGGGAIQLVLAPQFNSHIQSLNALYSFGGFKIM